MYVCMCRHIQTHTYTYHVCMFLHMYTYIHTYIHTYTYYMFHICTYTYACMYIYIYTYTHTSLKSLHSSITSFYIHTYVCVHIQTYICYMSIHMHIALDLRLGVVLGRSASGQGVIARGFSVTDSHDNMRLAKYLEVETHVMRHCLNCLSSELTQASIPVCARKLKHVGSVYLCELRVLCVVNALSWWGGGATNGFNESDNDVYSDCARRSKCGRLLLDAEVGH